MKEIKCSKCKKSIHTYELGGCIRELKLMGYGSKHDGELINLVLCPECTDSLLDVCFEYNIDDLEPDDCMEGQLRLAMEA